MKDMYLPGQLLLGVLQQTALTNAIGEAFLNLQKFSFMDREVFTPAVVFTLTGEKLSAFGTFFKLSPHCSSFLYILHLQL